MAIRLKAPGTSEVTVDGVSFTVRNEEYMDLFPAMQFNDDAKLKGNVAVAAGVRHMLMQRIVAWDGVEFGDGTKAECTEENKLALFGMRPELLSSLHEAIVAQEEQDSKN